MTGHVDPLKETFALFEDLPRDRPIRLRARAAYPDGREASGLDAYRAYAREAAPLFKAAGGGQVWLGTPELTVIGPSSERWDIAFIAEYPGAQALIDMLRDPAYREVVKHRQAAVEDSRLVRMAPATAGAAFGAPA